MSRLFEGETFSVTVATAPSWSRFDITVGELADALWHWSCQSVAPEIVVSFGPGGRFSVRGDHGAAESLSIEDVRAAWVTFRSAATEAEAIVSHVEAQLEARRLDDLDADLRAEGRQCEIDEIEDRERDRDWED